MKYLTSTALNLFKPCLAVLMLGTAAFAGEGREANIFNADLTHPDLALTVSKFEDTCMSFVLHKTEMPRALDRQHTIDILESRDFEFTSSGVKSERVIVGERPDSRWKTGSAALSTSGQFTVFNFVGSQVVESTQTIRYQTGDMRVHIPQEYKTINRELVTYSLRSEDRLTANLLFNYATQNHPGKSCEIRLSTPEITLANFTSNFIDKDKDWLSTDRLEQQTSWSQCIRDGEDEFEFTVKHKADSLSLHVTRNDFYSPEICINWLPAAAALQ